MEPIVMTPEELVKYLDKMPDNTILRVTIQEDSDEPDDEKAI